MAEAPKRLMDVWEEKFRQADTSGDGVLSIGELSNMLRDQYKMTDTDVQEIFDAMDTNKDTKVTWEEFSKLLKTKNTTALRNARLLEEFKFHDKDGSGCLDIEEIKAQYMKVFPKKTEEQMEKQVEAMLRRCDKDGDGKISYVEFLEAQPKPK